MQSKQVSSWKAFSASLTWVTLRNLGQQRDLVACRLCVVRRRLDDLHGAQAARLQRGSIATAMWP